MFQDYFDRFRDRVGKFTVLKIDYLLMFIFDYSPGNSDYRRIRRYGFDYYRSCTYPGVITYRYVLKPHAGPYDQLFAVPGDVLTQG